jgi:hypothetical protein
MSWDFDVKHHPGQDTRLDNAGCARCTAELGRIGSRRRLRRRWPGVSGGLCLGRPARRTPGQTVRLISRYESTT